MISMKKGISPLLSGTMFILITVVVATIVAGWLTVLSKDRSDALQNSTDQRLRCEYADLFAQRVSYDCNANCFTGVPYTMNATIKNGGSVKIEFYEANLVYNDGSIVKLKTTRQGVNGGASLDARFNDILIYSNPIIPFSLIDAQPATDQDTRGLWRFNEGTGNITEDAKFDNDGIIYASWSSGRFGYALSFNGTSLVVVKKSDELDIANNITIEAWIKSDNNSQESVGIICKGEQDGESYCLTFNNKTIVFYVRDAFANSYTATSSNTISDNGWHHVAGVYDSQKVAVYLDRVKSEGDTFDGELRINLDNLTFGNRETEPNTFVNGFQGTIDEVKISNTSRTFVDPTTVTSINLTYILSHPQMTRAILYDSQGAVVVQDSLNTDYFEKTINNLPVDEYRVLVEAEDGTYEKWYPSAAGSCIDHDVLDRITIVSTNCPNTAYDSVPGNEVALVNCA